MKVVEIAFVGYPVTDLKRARAFYEHILGLTTSRVFGTEVEGWIEYDLGANTLAIGNVSPDWKPSPGGGSVGLEVEDISIAIRKLKEDGHAPTFGPIETPVCHMAGVSDPDGNSIIIHQKKSEQA
ncbi:MAG: VOC family protein [Verrucomicrobia bacterium]|nr:VOC family protein [Verrucomicrobiota bacterium]MBV9671637.1 VOC family protein [Verrucomicrobiota bacterium]